MNESIVAELSDIVPFKDGKSWYLKLIYKYEDDKGKHTVVIPKAAIPFSQRSLPYITNVTFYNREDLLARPYMNCIYDKIPLYESVCTLASELGIKDPNCYFDIITEFATREMTLDEIEKELGYKVKIINKDDNIKEKNSKNE